MKRWKENWCACVGKKEEEGGRDWIRAANESA